jgi:hypothetical protein
MECEIIRREEMATNWIPKLRSEILKKSRGLVKDNGPSLNLTKPTFHELKTNFSNLKIAKALKFHLIIGPKDETHRLKGPNYLKAPDSLRTDAIR